MINPIRVNNQNINFTDKLEHVGITRSNMGNMSAISEHITAQKRAIGTISSVGLARSHLANPQAGLKVLQLYGDPIMFSGVGALFLNKKEIEILSNQHDTNVRNFQKFYRGTPECFYLLIGGRLPGQAILHQRQLSLFNMISRLDKNNLLVTRKILFL